MDYELREETTWNEDGLIKFVLENGEMGPDRFNQALMDYLNLIIKGKPIDDITLLTLRIS
jgi:sigma-B regulation protein RsbU (phosphoserine phosphatase)